MYKTILNGDTDVIHAVNSDKPDRGTPYSLCGCVGPYLRNFSVHSCDSLLDRNSRVTCKNCLKILHSGGPAKWCLKLKPAMKVYEFGDHDVMEEPTWIKTNRNIRLTSAAKRTGRYLKEVSSNFKGAAGIDLVIT